MLAIGNGELKDQPNVTAGQKIKCSECGGKHELNGGMVINENGYKCHSDYLLSYRCGQSSFLAAVDGKLLKYVELA